jgi:hypothetical protein
MSIKSGSIEGLDELIEACAKIGDEVIPHIEAAAISAGEKVLHKTKVYAEKYYRTGDLFHSLKLAKPSKNSKTKYTIFSKVTFDKGGAHGVPLELGHRLIVNGKQVGTVKERPFMRPAADESKNDVVDIIAAALNKALEEWGD